MQSALVACPSHLGAKCLQVAKQRCDLGQIPNLSGPQTANKGWILPFQCSRPPHTSSQALADPSPTLEVGHVLGVGVVPGEEGVMAEAAKAVGARVWGLGGPQCLSDHLQIHDPWDHQFFLWPVVLVASWPVP